MEDAPIQFSAKHASGNQSGDERQNQKAVTKIFQPFFHKFALFRDWLTGLCVVSALFAPLRLLGIVSPGGQHNRFPVQIIQGNAAKDRPRLPRLIGMRTSQPMIRRVRTPLIPANLTGDKLRQFAGIDRQRLPPARPAPARPGDRVFNIGSSFKLGR